MKTYLFRRLSIVFGFALVGPFFLHATVGEDFLVGKRRVAVFPFEIHSQKADDSFLSPAFSDTLTSALSQIKALVLTERGGLKRLLDEQNLVKAGIVDPDTAVKAGRILGAQTAVLGSFTRIGKTVRATCRLVDIETGIVNKDHLVKASRTLQTEEQIFNLMDALAKKLVATFDIQPTAEEKIEIARRTGPTKSFSAYEYYIKGREAFLNSTLTGYKEAIPLYKKAIELDPNFALAYAALAEATYDWGFFNEQMFREYQSHYDDAFTYGKKAVELKPQLAECQRALATAYGRGTNKDDRQLRYHINKALELNPNDSESYYILWALDGNDPDDASILKALALNPRLVGAHTDRATFLRMKGRVSEAMEHYQTAFRINPNDAIIHNNYAYALLEKGDIYGAKRSFERAIELNPDYSGPYVNLSLVYYNEGNYQKAGEYAEKGCNLGNEDGCHNVRLLRRKGQYR